MKVIFLVVTPEIINKLLEESYEQANSFTSAWNFILSSILSGRLFQEMIFLGKLCAVISFIFTILQLFRELEKGSIDNALQRLVIITIAVVLLAGNASLLKTIDVEMLLSGRKIINNVQQSLVDDVDAHKAIENITQDIRIARVIEQQARLCLESDNETQQQQCLEEVQQDAQELADALEQRTGFKASAANRTIETIVEYANDGLMFLGSLSPFSIEEPILWLLSAFQEAFDWVVETGMVLSIIMSPLAVGLMLFNIQAIIIWFSGFIAFITSKIIFVALQSIISVLLIYTDNVPAIIYGVLLAIYAPIISILAAGLSGLSVFNVFTQYMPLLATATTYRGVGMMTQSFRATLSRFFRIFKSKN